MTENKNTHPQTTKLWTASGILERQDRRYARAQMLAHEVMRRLEPFIACDLHRQVMRELLEAFHQEGVEVLTDYTRAEIGLPPRDPKGWTAEEILALEKIRLEAMTRPLPLVLVTTEAEKARVEGMCSNAKKP